MNLKSWFKIHFFVDILFGIPLLLFPEFVLGIFSIPLVETITARLVGAALLGIGGASFFTKTKEQFNIMLTLKIIWSSCAIIALLFSLTGFLWVVLLIFILFNILWIYYKLK